MEFAIFDWLNLLLRWAHIIIGIGWIGTSFYFIWLDESLRSCGKLEDGVHGESWMVHAGGFYHVKKYLVAPEKLPEDLHWFRYEAYFTWVTGFLLLSVIYYFGANTFLIDKSVMDLSPIQAILASLLLLAAGWVTYDVLCRSPIGKDTGFLAACVFCLAVVASWIFSNIFSGRAALIHTGAMLGTIMSANVFFVIIPNQKKVIAALTQGQIPDPSLGERAKQRSLHNNYLTLPVVLMMISNHYPMAYGHRYPWIIVAFVLLIGGSVRHFINLHDAGRRGGSVAWQLPLAAFLLMGLIIFTGYRPSFGTYKPIKRKVALKEVFAIVQTRCVGCHSIRPTIKNQPKPPADIRFDTPKQVYKFAKRIHMRAVLTRTMPPNNLTSMLKKERRIIRAWIRQGAKADF